MCRNPASPILRRCSGLLAFTETGAAAGSIRAESLTRLAAIPPSHAKIYQLFAANVLLAGGRALSVKLSFRAYADSG